MTVLGGMGADMMGRLLRKRALCKLEVTFSAIKIHETFVSATALRAAEDPDMILLCENWIDRENFMSVQLKRPYRNRYEARLPELLCSPRKLSFFEPIRSLP